MTDIKPTIAENTVLALLQDAFGQPAQALTEIQSGLISQTYSFRVGEADYILRVATDSLASFQKEAFIRERLAGSTVPIPPIVKMGHVHGLTYAISMKKRGRELSALSRDDYFRALPSNIETLFAIHQADVRNTTGYGHFDEQGVGVFASWKARLAGVMEEEEAGSFFGAWHKLFDTTFLERAFYERVYAHMLGLLDFCPEERYLLHGDYDYNNVLAEGEQITAVLDWANALYGDFVSDIAGVGFWRGQVGVEIIERFYAYYASQEMPVANFWERVACYQCFGGLIGLRFFAKTDNEPAYRATQQILQKLLAG